MFCGAPTGEIEGKILHSIPLQIAVLNLQRIFFCPIRPSHPYSVLIICIL